MQVQPQHLLSPEERDTFVKLFRKQHPDFQPEHTNIRQNNWTIQKWKKSEFDESIGKIRFGPGGNFTKKMEKITMEYLQDKANKRVTTIHPKQDHFGNNILLLVGMEESSRRDTKDAPANTTGVQHLGWGTGGTAEAESQTGLISATGARQDLDTDGQRSTINQTSKYSVSADDTDLTVPVTLKEAALYNTLTTGIAHARIQFPDFALTAGERITAQINELMANLVL